MERSRNVRDAVAANVRALRAVRGLSLGELASASGTGKATLSRIEAGQANPTVETLFALADALGVPFGALTADRAAAVQHVRAADLPRGRRRRGGARAHAGPRRRPRGGAGDRVPRRPGPLVAAAPAGRGGAPRPHARPPARGPAAATVEMDTGDVLRFAADVPHEYAALDGEPAGAMLLMAYPSAAVSGWT